MKIKAFFGSVMMGAVLLLFTACNGLFDGIYDDVDDEEDEEYVEDSSETDSDSYTETVDSTATDSTEVTDSTTVDSDDATDEDGSSVTVTGSVSTGTYGFTAYDWDTRRGTVYVNTSDYYTWTYLNFHTLTMSTLTIDLTADDILADEPSEWDIALHRWDTRTNGGKAIETDYTSLDAFEASGTIPSGTWVEDTWYEYVNVDMSGMMSGNIGYMSCYCNMELTKWMDVDTDNMPPVYTPSGKVYVVQFGDGSYMACILSSYMNSKGTKCYLTIDYIFPVEN